MLNQGIPGTPPPPFKSVVAQLSAAAPRHSFWTCLRTIVQRLGPRFFLRPVESSSSICNSRPLFPFRVGASVSVARPKP
jgi:hypothetical protein